MMKKETFICDACGEHKEGKTEVINTETLAGVVMCRDCHTPKDNEPSCACADPSCGNTQERVEKQIARIERLEKLAEGKEGKPEEVVNTETLCGVVMCRDCHTSRDFDAKCTNDACPVCGGNTPARIDEQIEWLEKKIAERVAEQHKDTFQKLADSPTPPAHLPKCKWHKDWHACDCGAFDTPDEDIIDDEEEALLNKMCDEIEAECLSEDFDYDRERMKETLQNILDNAD